MLNKETLDLFHKTLVIDIETVPMVPAFDNLSENMQKQWLRKAKNIKKYNEDDGQDDASFFFDKAGIYAEFGKIVCISIGRFQYQDGNLSLYIKSYADDNEQSLLSKCFHDISIFEQHMKGLLFCGHNIKEFDIPFMCRRALVQRVQLPNTLQQLSGAKSWQVPHMDTLEMWKFGDYKHYVSLDLLAALFNIESSKSNMDGSQVATAYWVDKRLVDIQQYCKADVGVTAQVWMALRGVELPLSIHEVYD